jgi:anti-sigma B factor antagonist
VDVSVSTGDGASQVRLAGEVDTYTVPDVRAAFDAVPLTAGAVVVVDLREVTFIDSSGLGAVIGLYHRARAAGATLRLLCDGVSLRLVRLTRLDQVIDVDTTPAPDHAVS